MKHVSLSIAALFLLAGCSSLTKPLQSVQQANLVTPCDSLPEFTGNTMGDLVRYNVRVIGMYHECAAKQGALSSTCK